MTRLVSVFLLAWFATSAHPAECDCGSYPFKPNPPCYGKCVAKLSSKGGQDVGHVRNIDPGVSVGIKILSESKTHSSTDFESIRGKPDLERAALKSLEARQNFKSKE